MTASSGPTRPRRRLVLGHPAIGTIVLASLVVLLAVVATGVYRQLLASDGDRVSALFTQTVGLNKGDPVRIAGVNVGQVERIEQRSASVARVVMKVEDSAQPIYADASASITWRTLLGGSYAIELRRGSADAGRLGDADISPKQTTTQVELDDLLSVNRGAARKGLQTMPRELADAFAAPDQPAGLLDALDDVSPSVHSGVGALRGQRPSSDLRALLVASARTMRALDSPTGDLERLVSSTASTVEITAARRDDLGQLIAVAPGVLQRANGTLARLRRTLRGADPVVRRLQSGAGDVAPTLRALYPTLTGARRLLGDARPLLRSLRPALSSLETFSRGGRRLLEELTPSLERIDRTILPYLAEVSPQTGRSTSQMIGPGFEAIGNGMLGHFDGEGHLLRFPATFGPHSVQTAPCQVLLTNPDAGELAQCQSVSDAIKQFFSYRPLGPTPGSAPPTRSER